MVSFLSIVVMFVLALSTGAQAQYTFEVITVPFAGATAPEVRGLGEGDLLTGGYLDAEGTLQGFLRLAPDHVVPLLNVAPQGLCAEGVVGWWRASSGRIEGFFYNKDGTFRTLSFPQVAPRYALPLRTEASACGAGFIVGTYRSALPPGGDGEDHGFLYHIATRQFWTIDAPDASSTGLVGTDSLGRILGKAMGRDGVLRLFRREANGTFTFLSIPGFADADVFLVGLTTSGLLAGNAQVGNTNKAFVFDGADVAVLAAPEASVTILSGIREDGAVYGRLIRTDGAQVGFVARPAPDEPAPGPRQPKKPRQPKERK